MSKNNKIITGIVFLIIAVPVIFFSGINSKFFPSQEVELRNGFEFFRMMYPNLFIQEITLKKRYFNGVDVLMANPNKINFLDNVILVLNKDNEVLFTKRFSSERIGQLGFYSFPFDKKIDVGKNNRVFLIIYSINSDSNNFIALPRKPTSSLGKFHASNLINNDVLNSLKDQRNYYKLEGSLCLKTYESDYRYFSLPKFILILFAVGIGCIIIFSKKLNQKISRLKLAPERIFLFLGLSFGLLFVFLIPPLQVPDEPGHFCRIFQLSELNLFQTSDKTTPKSLINLYSTFSRMNFGSFEKTTITEIKDQFKVRLEPGNRINKDDPTYSQVGIPNYIFPYTAQVLGLWIGRVFSSSPVALMYFGRIFNLLCTILMIYFAIKITPVLKWIFFLLGLMPMTLYLSASLSNSAMNISLPFLLTALFFRYAFGKNSALSWKELVFLFVLTFLLGQCKSINGVFVLLFFMLPVSRIGSLKKYIFIFLCLIATFFISTKYWTLRDFIKPSVVSSSTVTQNHDKQGQIENHARPFDPSHTQGVNQPEQQQFILSNPVTYVKVLYNTTFKIMRWFYLESFVGIIGHLVRHIPAWLIHFYLLVLLFTAILTPTIDTDIGWKNRLLALIVFGFGIVLVETGMYVGWTKVGQAYVDGVQGRYFIPFAPLFFLILISKTVSSRINGLRLSSSKAVTTKPGKTVKTKKEYVMIGPLVKNSITILIGCISFFTLIAFAYYILTSFFIVIV